MVVSCLSVSLCGCLGVKTKGKIICVCVSLCLSFPLSVVVWALKQNERSICVCVSVCVSLSPSLWCRLAYLIVLVFCLSCIVYCSTL